MKATTFEEILRFERRNQRRPSDLQRHRARRARRSGNITRGNRRRGAFIALMSALIASFSASCSAPSRAQQDADELAWRMRHSRAHIEAIDETIERYSGQLAPYPESLDAIFPPLIEEEK